MVAGCSEGWWGGANSYPLLLHTASKSSISCPSFMFASSMLPSSVIELAITKRGVTKKQIE